MSGERASAFGVSLVGSAVADYEVEGLIGKGGMSVVYRARDRRLDRLVALKILAPELSHNERFRRRFVRESRMVASLDHPHIIPIYEAGEIDGLSFIAMRYVEGRDLCALLEETGPMPLGRANRILSQVAAALDTAHEHGLVHRDVKPANVLITGPPDGEHAYLSDFGLTKNTASMDGLTSQGQFLGTPRYVAPEQITGDPVDGRCDQYALGCVAYETLTGAPPFQRDGQLSLIYAHVSEEPPPMTSLRPELPPAADEVMRRALAKAPGRRFGTCLQFVHALRDALSGDTGQYARPPAPPPPARDVSSRGRFVPPPGETPSAPGIGSPSGHGVSWPGGGSRPPDQGVAAPGRGVSRPGRLPPPSDPGASARGPGAPDSGASGRARALRLAALAAAVVLAVVAGFQLLSADRRWTRYPGSVAAPFGFDHPASWRAITHSDVFAVASPAAGEFENLFKTPISADWTAVDRLIRDDPDRAQGVFAGVSDTLDPATGAAGLQQSLQYLLPGTVGYSGGPAAQRVDGHPAHRLDGVLSDPAQQGRLDFRAYVVPRAGAAAAYLLLYCAPSHCDRDRMDRVVNSVGLTRS